MKDSLIHCEVCRLANCKDFNDHGNLCFCSKYIDELDDLTKKQVNSNIDIDCPYELEHLVFKESLI